MAKADVQKMAELGYYQLMRYLPEALVQMTGLIGIENTLKIVDKLGGLSYAVPRTFDSDSAKKLINIVGTKAAEVLIAAYGGDTVYISTCQSLRRVLRNQAVVEAILSRMETGLSQHQAIQEIAPAFGITERLTYLILKQADNKQLDLFDDFN